MTDETEAVARAHKLLGKLPRSDFDDVLALLESERSRAITAHTKALIEGAGELCAQLIGRAQFLEPSGQVKSPGLMREAAATIAAQKAEIERLEPYVEAFRREERRADDLAQKAEDAMLDGVRAGIEASAQCADHLGGGRVERNPDGSLCTYDMASKHGQGSATLNAMRVRAQTIATAIRNLDAEAIAKGEG